MCAVCRPPGDAGALLPVPAAAPGPARGRGPRTAAHTRATAVDLDTLSRFTSSVVAFFLDFTFNKKKKKPSVSRFRLGIVDKCLPIAHTRYLASSLKPQQRAATGNSPHRHRYTELRGERRVEREIRHGPRPRRPRSRATSKAHAVCLPFPDRPRCAAPSRSRPPGRRCPCR